MRMSSSASCGPVLAREQDRVVAVVGVDDVVAGAASGRRVSVASTSRSSSTTRIVPLLARAAPSSSLAASVLAERDLMRRRAARRAARSVDAWRRRRRRCCSIDRLALRRGSSARTRPRPETPLGIRARLKPAGSARAVARSRCATPSSSQSSDAVDRAVAPSVALCLTALVSSSLSVSAIGIASTSGRLHAAASPPSTRQWIGRPKVRCTEPVIASSTLDDRSGPVGADLQAVDLRDRLHLADDLVDRRGDLGLALGDLLQQPGHALQVVLDAVVHFLAPASRAARSPPRGAPPARRAAR